MDGTRASTAGGRPPAATGDRPTAIETDPARLDDVGGAALGASTDAAAALPTALDAVADVQATTDMSAPDALIEVQPAGVAVAPRPQLRELIAAYDNVLAAAERLPTTVRVRTGHRRARLLRPFTSLPRPSWLVRTFLLHHISGTLDTLERSYLRRAALHTAGEADTADRQVLNDFRRSLPAVHTGRLVALMLISVLVVGQVALVPILGLLDEDNATATGGGVEVVVEGAGVPDHGERGLSRVMDALSPDTVASLGEMITHALSAATLDFGSTGRLLDEAVRAGPLAFVTLVGYLLLILYLVLRPFVPAFRLKRALFNLHPDVDGYLPATSAPRHVDHSTGIYQLEAAAFQTVGEQSAPAEKPFDVVVLALPALVLTVTAASLAFLGGRWLAASAFGPRAYVLGVGVAVGLALLWTAPFVARLAWLRGVVRRRGFVADEAPLAGEVVLPGTHAIVALRRPAHLAVAMLVPYGVLSSVLAHEWLLGGPYPEELLAVLLGAPIISMLCFPWWYRIGRDLRDVGVAIGQPLGRRPAGAVSFIVVPGFLLAFGSWLAFVLGLCFIVLGGVGYLVVAARRIRRVKRHLLLGPEAKGAPGDLRISRLRPWMLPAAVLVPPLLIWHLQAQLNSVLHAVGRPVSGDGPAPRIDPSPLVPAPPGQSRRGHMAVFGTGVLAFAAVLTLSIEPAPYGFGDDRFLDAWQRACDAGDGDDPAAGPAGGDWRACEQLWKRSVRGSAYRDHASRALGDARAAASLLRDDGASRLDALHASCSAGDGDACLDLYHASPPALDFLEYAEDWRLGVDPDEDWSQHGFDKRKLNSDGAPRLDTLQEPCAEGDGDVCFELRRLAPPTSDLAALAAAALSANGAPVLDRLLEICRAGDEDACLEIYRFAPNGSDVDVARDRLSAPRR